MNAELKGLIVAVFAIIKSVEDAIAKKDFVTCILPDLYKVASDIPAITMNWNDLMPELKALSGADADADLVSFIISQVPSVTNDSHAQKVIQAALDLVLCSGIKAEALILALKG